MYWTNWLLIISVAVIAVGFTAISLWAIHRIRIEIERKEIRDSLASVPRVFVECAGRHCDQTDFTVDTQNWEQSLHDLDWRLQGGDWYCPLCASPD
jgi:hypothetical protein